MATRIRMEHAKSVVDPHVENSSKTTANLIEWNVDMRVTVSNVKRSKIFQRSRNIVIFILAIVFAVVLSHLRREVRALQVQMQCANVNLLALMSKYDKLNRSLNRAWFEKSNIYEKRKNLLLEGVSLAKKTTEILKTIHNPNGKSYSYNSVIPMLNPVTSLKEKYWLRDEMDPAEKLADRLIDNTSTESKSVENVRPKERSNLRIERAIFTIGKTNSTSQIRSDQEKIELDNESDDELDVWQDSRSGRSRRDEGRGKKRGKNRRRPKRSRRRLGPLVATFVGAIPEQHVTDAVYVGPWVKSTKNDSQYSLNKFHLVEDKKSIEVTTSGLYMISAQIFYFGEPTNYSYWILLSSEGKSTTQRLVKCSTASSTSATEVSCYTSVITLLRRGDRLHIQQQERDRLINMREGHSYIQLVLLSNSIHRKRLS